MITGWTDTNKNKFKSLYKDVIGHSLFEDNVINDSLEISNSSTMKLDTGEPYTHYENRTKEQIYNLARELDIPGRSTMNKDELIEAVRDEKN